MANNPLYNEPSQNIFCLKLCEYLQRDKVMADNEVALYNSGTLVSD